MTLMLLAGSMLSLLAIGVAAVGPHGAAISPLFRRLEGRRLTIAFLGIGLLVSIAIGWLVGRMPI